MKILFWNTHQNSDINSLLCDLIVENQIEVAVLAEYTANIHELINKTKAQGISIEHIPTIGCERLCIVGRSHIYAQPLTHSDHYSIQYLNKDLIMCCIHLNSQIYADHNNRREILIEQIIEDIQESENYLGTRNTVVVGDFNINPYSPDCISARYFHAIPIYEESKRERRTIAGKEYQMFYNPMWNLLGDFSTPYGTYYINSSDTINQYWNIYDQVIIRPLLRNRFINKSLKILTNTRNVSFFDKNGHPDTSISDHLPITFEIIEDKNEY